MCVKPCVLIITLLIIICITNYQRFRKIETFKTVFISYFCTMTQTLIHSSSFSNLQAFLDSKVAQYNQPGFIKNDPICIPHLFTKKQDIEIMGFWAATLAWGQRI